MADFIDGCFGVIAVIFGICVLFAGAALIGIIFGG